MAQITSGIRSILGRPWVYRLMKRLIGADRFQDAFAAQYLDVRPGQRVLDVGCGPWGCLDMLGDVDYLGIDISAEYIEHARRHSGGRGRYEVASASQLRELAEEPFDLVIAVGLLHHLDDDEARSLLDDSAHLLRSGGRLVTLDNVYTEEQSAIARFLISRDRGQNVRDRGGYEALGDNLFGSIEADIRDDLLRIPYTHIIIRWSSPTASER